MNELIKKIKNNEVWFCPQLFRHVYTHTNGYYAPCCVANNLPYHSSNVGIMEHMNSDIMSEIRYAMMTSKDDPIIDKYCSACKKSERDHGHSERTRKLKQFENELDKVLEIVKDGTVIFKERNMDFQLRTFGNKCNLDCLMCIPYNSSTKLKQHKKFNHLKMLFNENDLRWNDKNDYSKIEREVLEFAPYMETWQVQGGEPFVMKRHYEILEALIFSGHAKNIIIEFHTNGSVLKYGKHRMIDYLKHFKSVICKISIDGYGIYNDYIRRRSKWDQIVKNIAELNKLENIDIGIFSTLSLFSVINFHLLKNWCKENNWHLDTHVVCEPDELHCRHLPDNVKKLVAERNPNDKVLISALQLPRDDAKFRKAIKYCQEVDKQYNNALELYKVFPELNNQNWRRGIYRNG